MALYILSTVLAAFDLSHSPPSSQGAESRVALIRDAPFVAFAKKAFGGSGREEWKEPSMKVGSWATIDALHDRKQASE